MAHLVKILPENLVKFSAFPRRFAHTVQPVKLTYDEYLPKDQTTPGGAPVLIMHGLFGSRQNWRGISKRLTQVLKPGRRILSLDARNHGQSPHTHEHTYQHMAEDVREVIRGIPEAEKVILMGHSMGGRCMMYFALEYPELVESAIIVDISPFSNAHFVGNLNDMKELLKTLQNISIDPKLTPSAARKVADTKISGIMREKATRDFILLNLYKNDDSSLDFYITSDTGNADHWKYSVAYKEKLAYWPHWQNHGEAQISVKKLPQSKGGHLSVDSTHRTCFLYGLYCLRAEGSFSFSPNPTGGTHVVETVHFQCPPFLGRFCRAEVQFQRNAIMNNLSYQFNRHLL
ncbi:protein ABHD11-like isoform X1 [Lutzomyia longipalpis]|uniref:protein ABHD11-like isoform X1 n=1 Tax=Lutzomyia longipalpis TaxID=7200 RepID=UPI0024844CFC|nr:protein ABHD11-like isoform X1 [Lutzomyia longipalpis]